MIMAAIKSLAEAMTLAAKNGIEKAVLLDVLTNTLFGAPVLSDLWRHFAARTLRARGLCRAARPEGHEISRGVAAALASKVPMPFLAVLRAQLLAVIARHGDNVDWSALANQAKDVLYLGPPGVGKTPLAQAVGYEAIKMIAVVLIDVRMNIISIEEKKNARLALPLRGGSSASNARQSPVGCPITTNPRA